jgi:hypothetical protein
MKREMEATTIIAITARVPTIIPKRALVVTRDDAEAELDSAAGVAVGIGEDLWRRVGEILIAKGKDETYVRVEAMKAVLEEPETTEAEKVAVVVAIAVAAPIRSTSLLVANIL